MAGTKVGGLKTAATNKARYGSDFYVKIGAKGGQNGLGGGFALNKPCSCSEFPFGHYIRNCAGRKGGRISKRGKAHAKA